METIGSIFQYTGYVLGGMFAFLFIFVLIFGKRVIKKWEYEAKFYNDKRREIGEFDIEMRKYDKEEGFSLKAKFVLRHPSLTKEQLIKVYLDDKLVMEGPVIHTGRIYLHNEHLKSTIEDPEEGQICRVMCSAVELFAEPIIRD